jgi:uncharacterized membrane protein
MSMDLRTDNVRKQRPSARGHEPPRDGATRSGEGLALGLGLFSLGLGLAELTLPSGMARLIGVQDDDENRNVLRALGLREISSGLGILATQQPVGWAWSRVAGDAMDLTMLAGALASPAARRERLLMAGGAVLGVTLLDMLCAQSLGHAVLPKQEDHGGHRLNEVSQAEAIHVRGIEVRAAITINRNVGEVYRFFRNFENLPSFMSHLEKVEVRGDNMSHWVAKGPLGTHVAWDAQMTRDLPDQFISWASLDGADVEHRGSVRFKSAPGDRGTEVLVQLFYRPPAGRVGAAIAKLLGSAPDQEIRADLRALKQVLETGEVLHSDASIHRLPHPARPTEARALTERAAAQAKNGGQKGATP